MVKSTSDFNWGHRDGKKMAAEMDGKPQKMALGGMPRVGAGMIGKPRVMRSPMPAMKTPSLGVGAPPSPMTPRMGMMPGFKDGGHVKVRAHQRGYARGGKVEREHKDEAADKKLIKKEVKSEALKKAMGGKIQTGKATPEGAPKKSSIPSAKSKLVTPKRSGKNGIGG